MNDPRAWTEPPRVLAVDDEEVVCESIRRGLAPEGYAVTTYTSSRAALEAIRKESFDLLLLDIRMPEVDGLEFLRATRATGRGSSRP